MIIVCNSQGHVLEFTKEAFALRATLVGKTGTGSEMYYIDGSMWWLA